MKTIIRRAAAVLLLIGGLALIAGCKNPAEGDNRPAIYAIAVTQQTGGVFTVRAGEGEPSVGDTRATAGTTVTLSAAPAAGYRFKRWIVTGAAPADAAANPAVFTMPDGNITVTAEFEALKGSAITVTQPANGGFTVRVGNGAPVSVNTQAAEGANITLSAAADTGYRFKRWTVTGVSLANAAVNPATFIMPEAAVTVTAEFEDASIPPVMYALTVTQPASGGGFTVTAGNGAAVSGNTEAAAGTTITLSAEAAAGYRFKQWTVTGVSLDNAVNPAVFAMPEGAVTVTAEFEVIPANSHAITIVDTGNGTLSVNHNPAAGGETVTITVSPAGDYRLTAGSLAVTKAGGGAVAVSGSGPYTFTMPDEPVNVTAAFEAIPPVMYALIVTQPANGGFTVTAGSGAAVSGSTEAAEGTTITLTATAASGYRFEQWTVTGAAPADPAANPAVFTMPAGAVTVTAVFAVEEPPFTGTNAQAGLGVYVYDRNPSGAEFFAQWVGLDIKYAEDFLGYDYWQSYTGEWWSDYNPRYWSEWKAAKPGRRLILAVSPFPKDGLSGSWDGGKAATPRAREKYQEAANGDYNAYYRQLGEKLKELGLGDTIIRFGHEMSGNWYVYSIRADGDSEAVRQEKQLNYGRAFNQFAETLRGIAGTNFEFCWNPATDCDPAYLSRCYPGDEYVDYIAFDQYDYWMNAYDRDDYHNSTDPAFRRTIQVTAWNQMMSRWGNPNWFVNFAEQHNKPLAIAEWGLWRDNRNSGYDNPYFIEKMYEFINEKNVAWHTYFMFGDVSHSLYDTRTYTLASQKFQELWNPRGSPQLTPAIPPSAVSGYTGPVLKAVDAATGSNVALVSDPWAWPDGLLAGMWTQNDSWNDTTTITFENCPASSGFALVYQLWHSNLSNDEASNNQRVSLYVNGTLVQSSITLQHGGRGWGDSYKIKTFDVEIPEGASIMFKADQWNWAWTRLNFNYIVLRS